MILSQEQIDFCMECGVCTGSCPTSRVVPDFSPRQMIKRALMDKDESVVLGREIWACLGCARCSNRCPVQIDFPEFSRSYRVLARKEKNFPQLSHHGTLQAISSLQTRDVKQQRTDWAREAGKFVEAGEYLFFVGCAPFFDATLKHGAPALKTVKSVLRIFNRLGIEPVISNDERCCGHDALWSGDEDTFKRLVERNLEVIRGAGARWVIFSCPEGYATYKYQVPKYFGELPFEVLHSTEFFADRLPSSGLTFKPAPKGNGEAIVTFQDPCRLGRRSGIYDAPRDLIRLVPETRFVEMSRNRENAVCCGTSAWMECSRCSKTLQIERLQEALDTGARTLVTACPKCQIHLNCAKDNTDLDLDIVDLYSFILDRIE